MGNSEFRHARFTYQPREPFSQSEDAHALLLGLLSPQAASLWTLCGLLIVWATIQKESDDVSTQKQRRKGIATQCRFEHREK